MTTKRVDRGPGWASYRRLSAREVEKLAERVEQLEKDAMRTWIRSVNDWDARVRGTGFRER